MTLNETESSKLGKMRGKWKQNPQPSTTDQRIAELELELMRERANNQMLQVNTLRLQKLLER